MDYVVGSIAALISGNVTPSRPKLLRRALTPTKHQSSPNVTPKSEFVEDRSIFLSPTMQKKKAIVKKSPKRIFENSDLDGTDCEGSNTSPKADKVKKHLKDDLDADDVGNSTLKSPDSKLNKSSNNVSQKKSKNNSIAEDIQEMNERTPKKKKKQQGIINDAVEPMVLDTNCSDSNVTPGIVQKSPKKKNKLNKTPSKNENEDPTSAAVIESNIENPGKSPKKKNKKNKSITNAPENMQIDEQTTSELTNPQNPNGSTKKKNKLNYLQNSNEISELKQESQTETNKKNKNKKRKKKPKKNQSKANTKENQEDTTETMEIAKNTDTLNPSAITEQDSDSDHEPNEEIESKTHKKNKKPKKNQSEPATNKKDKETEEESPEGTEVTESVENTDYVNPNAITEQDTDSEHDSDDNIESENEEMNKEVLDEVNTEPAEESSDEEEDVKSQKPEKKIKENEVATEDEVKRTIFVGNVPFSSKCKKEIKKIFSKHGPIETVRIRTVPVKDARVTPKLAVIKNELHPERSTVNVYVKFRDQVCVENALTENNTILNGNHLRVSRSDHSGAEHDPSRSVFVGNLPFSIEDDTFREKFQACGEIVSVRVIRDKKTNAGKGFGYINFESKDGVELALALTEDDLTIKNRILRVKRCTPTQKQKPQTYQQSHQQRQQNRPQQNQQGRNVQGGFKKFGNQAGNQRGGFNKSGGKPGQFGGKPGQFGGKPGQSGGKPGQFGGKPGQFGGKPGQFGGKPRPFGDNSGQEEVGAFRRIQNKRKFQEGNAEGPPNKKQRDINQPIKEKKTRKEFVGMTAEKKKKNKFDKTQKKKKALSEILTKRVQ